MAPTAPDGELPCGIARFWSADGRITGSGFLIAGETLCTCAHVVASALGTDETAELPPTSPVTVDFPLLSLPSPLLRATVTHWRPVTGDGSGDVALLHLDGPVPGTTPVRLVGGTAVWDHAFRVLGFPARTDDHGVWVDGRLRAPVGKGWTSMEARPLPGGPSIGRGFSGSPVWDTDQGGVVGMTVAAEVGTGATTAYLIPAALLVGMDPALRPSPFRGLEPFREEDTGVFFARGADSERIARAARHQPFVPVAGASGVGKSSLVRAGVLPLLRVAGYTVTDFVGQPGAAPVGSLLAALRDQFPHAPALGDLVREVGGRVSRENAVLIGARLLEHGGTAGHVIFLDQFEETVGAEPVRARDLLDVLLTMATARHRDGRLLRVMTTLRSSSLEDLVVGGDAERLSVTVQMVAPMTPAQLAEIVRRPLDAVPGVDFEPGLAERIVTDAGTEPGALPLVEFVLSRLWDLRDRGRLTHDAYQELGGVEGALAAYADQQLAEVCKADGGPDTSTARRLFEQLVLPDGDKGSARVARAYDALPDDLKSAAQALAATRLLVIGRDSGGRETVALTHESLVRQWPMLQSWLDDSRAFRVWQERLRTRLREWEDGDRHPDLLLRGQELAAARGCGVDRAGELDVGEAEFIALSRQYWRRTVRRGRAGVALVAVLALVAGLLAFFVQREFDRADLRAKEKVANQLADRAEEYADRDPIEGAALAVLAHRTAPTDRTYKALLAAHPGMSMVESVDEGFLGGRVTTLAASADGGRAALLEEDDDGRVRGFVVNGFLTGKPWKAALPNLPAGADRVTVSDDGARVAAAGPEGQGRVWDAATLTTLDHWKGSEEQAGVKSLVLDFSADGRLLLHLRNRDTETNCTDGVEGDQALWYLRDIQKRLALPVPPGPPGSESCLEAAALPAGAGTERLMVLVESREVELGSYSSTVRLRSLEPGRPERKVTELEFVLLASGGRALWAKSARESRGHRRDLGSLERIGGAGWYLGLSRADVTGRFSVSDMSAGFLWYDTRTGASYVTRRPSDYQWDEGDCPATGPDLVTVRKGGGPVLYLLCNRNLVSFRMLPVGDASRRHTAGVFSPSGRTWAVLGTSSSDRLTVSLLGGRHRRERQAGPDDLPEEGAGHVLFSEDGQRLVVWGELGWALFEVGAGGLKPVDSKWDMKRPLELNPLVRDVSPLGGREFLLLAERDVQRLDGDGDLSSVRAPACGDTNERSPAYCLAVEVSPKQDRTAWLLRRDGTLTSWNPDGSSGQEHMDLGPPAVDFDPRGMRFRDDGERLAVTLRDETVVLNPDTRRLGSPLPARGVNIISAYDGDGRIVVRLETSSRGSPPELWSEGEQEAAGPLDDLWETGAWRITDGVVHNGTHWGTWTVPLDPDALVTAVCRALGDYDPLYLHADAPPDAYSGPPCPDPSS